jgi:hypothetical protein
VIKTLLLPQLIYLFSVLCIPLPKSFFKDLNKLFFKFIWNGGNDRVKRKILCTDLTAAGLRMIDPLIFHQAQKMVWVKFLLDESFHSTWKNIELGALESIHSDVSIFWRSFVPEKLLTNLNNIQVADSLRTWYFYREKAFEAMLNLKGPEYGAHEYLWFNRQIRTKSKQYFFYQEWYDKGIRTVSDLLNYPVPNIMLFEDLIIEFDISYKDRRKYDSLMKNIPWDWLNNPQIHDFDVFDYIVENLLVAGKKVKIPRYTYFNYVR